MLKKGISGLLLAGVLFLNAGTAALAAENTVPDIKDHLEVVKYFEMAEGLSTPNINFTFTAENSGQNPEHTPELPVNNISYETKDTADVENGKVTIQKTGQIILPEADQFPHAGEYLYTIKENNEHAQNSHITYSEEQYTLRVRVKNADMGKGLVIASVSANKDSAGDTDKDKNKVDEIAFTNTYGKNSSLTIEKNTTGDFADKTKKFEFTITFTKKAEDDVSEYKGMIDNQPVDCTAGTPKTFWLANDEKLVFNNIPVGTRYVVEEAASEDGYTPSVTVTENDTEQPKKTAEGEKQGISSAPDNGTDSLVGEYENKVVFENAYQDIAITGVMMNNLPFILLVAVAASALGILIFMKKKTSGKK